MIRPVNIPNVFSVHEPFRYSSGQVLPDEAGLSPGQLGSTTGSDVTDPAWTSSGLHFDGGDYVMLPNSIWAGGAFTLLFVGNWNAVASTYFYSEGNSGSDSNPIWAIGPQNDGTALFYFANDAGVNTIFKVATGTPFDGNFHSLAYSWSGTTLKCYIDGTQTDSNNYTPGTATLNKSTIGEVGRITYGSGATGTLAAMTRHQRVLTDSEIAMIHAYYRQQLAQVGVTLPKGPTVTTVAPVAAQAFGFGFGF